MSVNLNPNVLQAYDRLLSNTDRALREEDPNKKGQTPLGGPGPMTSTGTPVVHATQSDIVIAFIKVSDRVTQQLKDMRDCLDELNKKVEDLGKRMSEASKNAANISGDKDNKRGGADAAEEIKKLAAEMKSLTVTHGDVTIKVDMSLTAPSTDSGKGGSGFSKDQWQSVSQQLQTDISAIQTNIKSLSSDMQINISNWQTFSGQLIKGLEQMASGLTRIAGND